MSRGDLGLLTLLAILVLGLGAVVPLTDSAWISRHSHRVDRPWSERADAPPKVAEAPFNAAFSDKVNLIWPDAVWLAEQRAEGTPYPLWNPDILGGVPTGTNPLTQTFYPLNLVGWTGPPLMGLLIQALLHLLLGGLFFHLWMRSLGLSAVPAGLAAIAFAFSGWVASHLHNTPIVAVVIWIPLGLFAVERFLLTRKAACLIWLTVAIGMMWLAGFPQHAVLGSTAIALYAAVGWLRPMPGARTLPRGLLLAGAAILGLMLAGPQLTTVLEARDITGHQGKELGARLDESWQPGTWVGLAFPRALGGAGNEFREVTGSWEGHRIAQAALANPATMDIPNIANWSERTIYPGLVILFLAIFGAFGVHRRGTLRLLLLAACGICIAALEPVIRATGSVPGFKEGAPARGIMLLAIVLPALAGLGLEHLWKRGADWAATLLGVVLIGLGAGCAWLVFDHDAALDLLIAVLRETGRIDAFGVGDQPIEKLREYFRHDAHEYFLDLKAATIALGGAGLLLLLHRKLARGWFFSGLGLLLVLDLLAFFVPPNRPVDREDLFRKTPAIRHLQTELGHDRFMRVATTADEARNTVAHFIVPNLGLVFGLRDAQGWREQVPLHATEVWESVAAMVIDVGVSGIPADRFDHPLLDLARVRFLVAPRPIPALAEHRIPMPGDETVAVYENRDRLPVAWLVTDAEVTDDATSLTAVRTGGFDPRTKVLLAAGPDAPLVPAGAAEPSASTGVTITASSDDAWTFEVHADQKSWLVVSETWFPGWTATATPRGSSPVEVPVRRANHAWRAIEVPAGSSTIRMSYRPESVRGGILLAAGALVLLGLLVVIGRRRTAPPITEEPVDGADPALVA